MKKLLGIVVLGLFLITPSQADDIRDFQIEGMSIGDSLLDYFTKEKIMRNKMDWFNNDKFSVVASLSLPSYETYEIVQIAYKTKDKKIRLKSIEGIIFYKDNIKECNKKLDEITNELSGMFNNTKKRNKKTFPHNGDKTGKSLVTDVVFKFNNGDLIMIGCVDWSNELESKWRDHLRVTIRTKEYDDFLQTAYE